MDLIKAVEQAYLKKDPPKFGIGDRVKVHVKVTEGSRQRVQVFEGTVIGRKGEGVKETYCVRRVSHGVGVERIFPLHSPVVEKVDIVRRGKVRRAKLYYLRDKIGKAAKVKVRLK